MIYLQLLLLPLSMAAGCFLLRKRTTVVTLAGVATLIAQVLLVLQIPLDNPVRLLGVSLTLNDLTRLFLVTFLILGAIAFVAARDLPHGENFVPVALVMLTLSGSILLLQDLFIVALLLVAASFAAVLAIVDLPPNTGGLIATRTIASALKYLVLMVIAAVLIYLGLVFLDIYRPGELPGRIPLARFVLALLSGGFALRLGLLPFHAWLLDITEDAEPMATALIVAVLNTTALLVLVLIFQSFPVLLIENPNGLVLMRLGALVTSLFAGLLALGQTAMRRMVAYLLIFNCGIVFYGLVSLSPNGLAGAVFGALNQAIAALLIFMSVGLLEQPDGRPGTTPRRDLLRRWPVAGAGFIGGCMALLGLPPFSGFTGMLLVFQAATTHGWIEVVPIVFSILFATLAFARILWERLLGPSEDLPMAVPILLGETELDRPAERRLTREPPVSAVMTVLLLVVTLGIGLQPQPVLALIDGAIRGLAFIKAL